MKKILSILLLISSTLILLPIKAEASDTGYFIVTAYYSPLPDQEYYITGNYESEKRLNWNGIAWASWKDVFSGMLAAPGKYWFGTKIELDWLGVGSVDDRWWAIVPAWERGYGHDRIDVWVGFWDEWLRRAMYWGKRKVEWKVISQDNNISLDYNTIPAPSWAVPKTTTLYGNKVQVLQTTQEIAEESIDIFGISLWKWSDSEYVTQLQSILREIWYYTLEETTGEYDTHTIDAVYNLQINNNIVLNEHSKWAGSYGPQTRIKLKEIYKLYKQEVRIKEDKLKLIETYKLESESLADNIVDTIGKVSYGDISPEVRQLQKLLSQTWYFNYKDTAIFWVKTRNAVINFQLENNIIQDLNEVWAGTFWPKTKKHLSKKISEQNLIEVLKIEWLLGVYNEFRNTELWDLEIPESKEITKNIIYSI